MRANTASALSLLVVLILAPVSAAVRPPRLQYSITTLSNGLTVVLSEDHSTPIVHADLWYHVGSKDERPGRTGYRDNYLSPHTCAVFVRAQIRVHAIARFTNELGSLTDFLACGTSVAAITFDSAEEFVTKKRS